MNFQVLFCVFVNSQARANVDTNLSHQTTCPEFGLVQLIQEEFSVQYKDSFLQRRNSLFLSERASYGTLPSAHSLFFTLCHSSSILGFKWSLVSLLANHDFQ